LRLKRPVFNGADIIMPKLKTYKSLKKRVKITKNNKVLVKKGGQDHFNARESGKTTKNKRRKKSLGKENLSAVKKLIPKVK